MTRPERSDPPSEHARRLVSCWQSSGPTNDEVERLRLRLARRSTARKRSPFKMLVVALAQGFVLGGASIAAAAWVATQALPLFKARAGDDRAESARELERGRHPSRGTARAAEHPGHEAQGNGAPNAAAFGDVADPRAPQFSGPPLPDDAPRPLGGGLPAARGPARSLLADAHGSQEARPRAAETDGADELGANPPQATGPWARVARALSASDWQSADRALVELSSSGDPSTRDAADLARAELQIAHGQGQAFRRSVERLARDGHTPLIRRRAARLLERLQ